MKKFIKVKFLMLLTICLLVAASVFCAGRNTLSARAYTDDEIAAAKAWLSANGYSPSRAGAAQAYQDYLNGKFGPIQGSETPPAENTPPADDESQGTNNENAAPGTPEAGAEQPNTDATPEAEQPDSDAATDTEQPAATETQPKSEDNVNTTTETKKESSDTTADSKKKETDSTENTKKKETGSDENTKKNEVLDAATSKDNNTSSTGTQNKDTVTNKNQESLAADTAVNDASAIDLASASEIPDTTTAAGAAAIGNVPAETAGNSYTIVIVAVILVAAGAVSLIIYLRKKNERTAS